MRLSNWGFKSFVFWRKSSSFCVQGQNLGRRKVEMKESYLEAIRRLELRRLHCKRVRHHNQQSAPRGQRSWSNITAVTKISQPTFSVQRWRNKPDSEELRPTFGFKTVKSWGSKSNKDHNQHWVATMRDHCQHLAPRWWRSRSNITAATKKDHN